ncbi:MAG: carboxypeptidase-like regulatory domain-containing protein, partial [Flavobacteriales bacterium]|nr:carboxypeptidase-like regulatory domain-containing protein [Flavobacteriales bacterium]
MRTFLTLLVFLSAFGLQAQTIVQGRVSDAATGEALAFVHVLAAGEREGTTTDIDGRFRLAVRSLPVDLQFSYVGYAAATVTVHDPEPLNIPLQRTAVQLREAEVVVGENPAHRIIERVWAERKVNDGMRYRSHRYRSYSKTIFTAELDSAR